MTLVNIGILGCGEAGQILHIPALRQLPDLLRVTAIHDQDNGVGEGVAATLPFARSHPTAAALLDDPDIHAVLVAAPNQYHADLALAALKAGKHVMIEKPMCMTLDEADALAEAQAATGRVVQVGYMRRHAPGFEEAVRLIQGKRITYARVRDIIGFNHLFIQPTSHVLRGTPPNDAAEREAEGIRWLAGTDTGPRALVARLLLGLSTHDISAMREILGMPRRVLSAHYRQDGLFFTVQFDYGDFICQFETGIDSLARFDCEIEVLSTDQSVQVIWDTPYVRNQPVKLRVTTQNTEFGIAVNESHPSRQDSFVTEWQRFHAAITQGGPVKTDIADARQDLVIFRDIMAKLEG